MALEPYHVSAYNTAKASENKIHDDATARRFGFSGGLVGGVHVYAYMTHLPVRAGAVRGSSAAPATAGSASRSTRAKLPRSVLKKPRTAWR